MKILGTGELCTGFLFHFMVDYTWLKRVLTLWFCTVLYAICVFYECEGYNGDQGSEFLERKVKLDHDRIT